MSDIPDTSSKISTRLVKIFTIVVVLTIGLFGSLVWYTWDTFRYLETTQKNYFRLTELSGSIVHFDEVLTMSTRMAAATGDQRWEARYRRFETKLDAAIKETMVLGQGFSLEDAADKTNTANLNLLDMENHVFALVRKGQTDKALAILSSAEYDVQKKDYLSSIAQVTETIRQDLEKNISEYRHRGYLSIGSILIITPCLVFGWILTVRLIRRYNTNRKQAEEALRESEGRLRGLAGEMEVIAELGRLISSTLDIEEVYERFAAEVRKLIDFDRLAINLCDFEQNTTRIAYTSGVAIDGRRGGDSVVLAGTFSEEIVRKRSGMLVQSKNMDEIIERFPPLAVTFQSGLHSLMAVPLVYRNEPIGVLHFRSKKPNAYTKQDLQLAERIGGQIAGAIAAAQLYAGLRKAEQELKESEQRYRELSIIDDLTQLYNSRHFYFQLKIELDRSNRYEQPLTLLLLDLDNFKHFNDAYGHVEGDQVLLRLGQVVKRCLRETDFAYRYGGEEFTILLPMTTSAEGAVTAERIRTEFKKEIFSPAPGQDVHVTVSIGLAQYKPQEEMKAFVHRVDQLMYQGKKNGKDRVCSES